MFIRKVTHKDKKNGIEYYTYKIAESVRTERGPRLRFILNLGTNFEFPKDQWKELANRIEEIVTGQETLFEYPAKVEKLARKYATKIIRRQSEFVPTKKEISGEYAPDYQTVDVNSIENEDVRSIGAEHAVYETIKELEIDKKLSELEVSRPQIETAIGVIAGRLIAPGSERASHKWLKQISGIDEIMNTDFSLLPQDRVYKVSDMLLSKKEEIEEHLRCREQNLFNLEEKIILYDLTNTFFEGSGRYNVKARYGRSKEKRTDCPLVTLGLVLDNQGFPKKSKVFNGNVSEPQTLSKMVKGLSSEDSFLKPIIVLDAGIASCGNIKWLKEQSYDYLVVSRGKKKSIPLNTPLITLKEDKGNLVQACFVQNEENNDIELYCHSSGKEKKENSIKTLFQQRFEKDLENIKTSLNKKHGVKGYDKVCVRVGRLKEKYSRISHHYEITVEKDNTLNNAIGLTLIEKEKDNTNGVYYLRTSRTDLTESDIWNIYVMLTDIEDAFRCMKSELGLRPVHHQKETRVDGHLFITLLAYHILHTIRFKLRKAGINDNWTSVRNTLCTHARITTMVKTKDGKIVRIRKSSLAEVAHKEIYNALNISSYPGMTIKSIL